MTQSFTLKRGDTLPSFEARLIHPDGTPVTFAAGDSAEFFMKPASGALKVNGAAVTLTQGSNVATYAWQGTDTDTAGTYTAEIVVTFADGNIMTWPNEGFWTVNINADIDGS